MSRAHVVYAVFLLLCMNRDAGAQTPAPAPPPPPPPLWDVQVGAAFVGASGNSDTSSTGADFLLHRRWPVWQIESTASAVRASDHDVVKAERYVGTFRGQRKLSTRIGLTTGIKGERDQFSGIDGRSIVDGGLTWALVRAPRWTLDGITAAAWMHESPIVGATINDGVGVLQLSSRIPFGSTGDTTQRLTVYPNFTRSEAYRTETEVSAQAAMNSRLALKIGYLLRYSHAPVLGFKTTDHLTTASVVVRWRSAMTAQ